MVASTSLAAAETHQLFLRRVFDAPRPLVWRAWTQPERAVLWWGPQGHDAVSCKMDVRPGGRWYREMRAPDGGRYVKYGVYREVIAPERLVFTYLTELTRGEPDHETLVTVTLAERGGRTELTLRHELFATAAARVSHEGGWSSCLERFAGHLAGV